MAIGQHWAQSDSERASGDALLPSALAVRRPKDSMARETVYLVQAFTAGKGGSLKGEVPIPCKSAEGARRTAERLATSKVGVVAFSSSGDPEMGDYDDEPTVILRIGRLPAAFE